MATKTSSKTTKHEELTRTLLDLARSLTPGDQFPSQAELMRRYRVSDRTVLRSLDDLQRAGWILRQHGRGTFVADPARRDPGTATPPPVLAGSKTIGALVHALGPVYQHFLDRLTEQSEDAGLSLVCHHTRREDSFEDALPLEALRPRGFVLFSYYLLPLAKRLRENGHRVVIVGAPPAGVAPEVSCVYNDQEDGAYQATRHLIDLGHRRVAYVVPETRYRFEDTMRWHGHLRAVADAERRGIPLSATVVARETWQPWREDAEACRAFFAHPDAPTGLLTWNDDKAVELLHLLYRAGVRVPDDVSLVGYDALPVGTRSIPPLTTIDSQIDTQLRAVMRFLTQLTPPPAAQSVVVTPTLVRRASASAPPPFRR